MGKLGDALAHPDEILPLIRIYAATKRATRLPDDPKLAFCYDMLNKVSRSFAVVIQQLPNPLRDAICVFYLVLRGLDTVEDDMALSNRIKLPALRSFHERIYERGFCLPCGYGHYVRLMDEFGIVVDVFLSLEDGFRRVIADITRRMGEGMADFIEKEVMTVEDYDLYCHYVAGLVGIGLSQLFASSGLESSSYARADTLANHMGLFLQKTNIIRDYLIGWAHEKNGSSSVELFMSPSEDICEEPAPRMFWPRQIWGSYAEQLDDLRQASARPAALRCLNHMVYNALQHLPHCMAYMEGLRNPDVFRFCAIPQIMAIGTLALCYNNGGVFEGVVKLRRGLTARVFDECDGMEQLHSWFMIFLLQLQDKATLEVAPEDPTRKAVLELLSSSLTACEGELARLRAAAPRRVATMQRTADVVLLLLVGVWFYAAWGLGSAAAGAASLEALLPAALRPGSSSSSSGALLPTAYAGLEKALALMLLLAAVSRVVLVRLA